METQAVNAKSLKNIDDSIFVFCLDDYSSPLDLDLSHRNIFHGRNGRNRWFDKALQFIVENNGRAGINGEVSTLCIYNRRVIQYFFLAFTSRCSDSLSYCRGCLDSVSFLRTMSITTTHYYH